MNYEIMTDKEIVSFIDSRPNSSSLEISLANRLAVALENHEDLECALADAEIPNTETVDGDPTDEAFAQWVAEQVKGMTIE